MNLAGHERHGRVKVGNNKVMAESMQGHRKVTVRWIAGGSLLWICSDLRFGIKVKFG